MKIAAKILGIAAIVYAAIWGVLAHIITVPVFGTLGFIFALIALIKAIKGKTSIAIGVLYIIFAWDIIGGIIMIVSAILNKKLAANEVVEEVEEEFVEYAE